MQACSGLCFSSFSVLLVLVIYGSPTALDRDALLTDSGHTQDRQQQHKYYLTNQISTELRQQLQKLYP